jgi:hypothetical protein
VSNLAGRVAAAVACALLLGGCTASRPLPPGPDAEELRRYAEALSQQYWDGTGLGDTVARPEVAVVRFVRADDWSRVIASCMTAAGYEGYQAAGRGLESVAPLSGDSPAETVAMYTCLSQYPYDPAASGLVGARQLDLVYDYYARFLVPCLAVRGYDVGEVPTRKAFVENGGIGAWTPYWGVRETDQAAFRRLELECPPRPAWLRE